MACSVCLADEASRDLDGIVAYLCKVLGAPTSAAGLLDALDAFIDVDGTYPEAHPLCADANLARSGHRKALLKSYVVLYREVGDEAVISRIFHQSQDYARLV